MISRIISRAYSRKCSITFFSTAINDIYDIVVVGGGVAGSLIVSKLLTTIPASDNIKIALIEGSEPPQLNTTMKSSLPDIRNFALSPASINSLSSVGAWQLMNSRAKEYNKMQVWNENGSGYIGFSAADSGNRILGGVAEQSCIISSLFDVIHKLNSDGNRLSLFTKSKITRISMSKDPGGLFGCSITSKTNEQLSFQAKLVIAADGAQSTVRQQSGISSYGWSYAHQPIVGILKLKQPSPSTAFQIMTKYGPLAMLPMFDDYASFIWSIPLSRHPADLLSSMTNLLTSLPTRSPLPLPIDFIAPPSIESLISSYSFPSPLSYSSASCYYRDRVVLVADAAHTCHVMAGQGLNLGIADAEALVKVVLMALRNGMDLSQYLSNYDHERRMKNNIVMSGIDGLYRLYGYSGKENNQFMSDIRNIGMSVLNSTGFVKGQLIKVAIGLSDDDEHEVSNASDAGNTHKEASIKQDR